MIIAMIKQNGTNLAVEVTGTLDTGDGRKLATVRALEGEPFTRYTMGGPCSCRTANVRPDSLLAVAIAIPVESLQEVTHER